MVPYVQVKQNIKRFFIELQKNVDVKRNEVVHRWKKSVEFEKRVLYS